MKNKLGVVSIVEANSILGAQRVFVPKQIAAVYEPYRRKTGLSSLVPPMNMTIPYSAEILWEIQKIGGDWCLIYSYGFSLRELRQTFGNDPNCHPHLYHNNIWWLRRDQDFWATRGVWPGWYLLDLSGRFNKKLWHQQEKSIAALGSGYERVSEHLLAEAFFATCLINNGEQVVENYWHWGKSLTVYGSEKLRVIVGFSGFVGDHRYESQINDASPKLVGIVGDGRGFRINGAFPESDAHPDLSVCIVRKPELVGR